jgi:imidazolonepropionase-like amidohydrolase
MGSTNFGNMTLRKPVPSRTIIRDVHVFDGISDQIRVGVDVLLDGARVTAVSTSPIATDQPSEVLEIHGGGRYLIPGLTDAHVHLMGNANTMAEFMQGPTGTLYGNTIAESRRMLLRGFTTVRDMGGDTAPIKDLIDRGVFEGPRIFPSQAMISQTSGHADFAFIYDIPREFGGHSSRTEDIHFTRVADGVPQVLTAVREQLRQGASQIKLTLGGGAASMYDPLSTLQYIPEEISAAVRAANDYGTYVAAHVYSNAGIARALDAGVSSIEHGHLADEATVARIGEANAWLSIQPFAEDDHHYPDAERAGKNAEICRGTEPVYGWAKKHGVKTAWGTDLLLEPQAADRQNLMAARLSEYYSDFQALKMLTSGNAELFEMAGERNSYRAGRLGVIAEGGWADLILVDGDPSANLSLVANPDRNFRVIIKNGQIVKNEL